MADGFRAMADGRWLMAEFHYLNFPLENILLFNLKSAISQPPTVNV